MGNSASSFVWYELATSDIEGAKAFYANVMGWGTIAASMPGSNYTQFTAGNTPVAGLLNLPAEASRTGAAPQWIGFAGVDDVDAAAGRAMQLGGTVHVPPANAGNATRFSVIADPQTALLALVTKPKRNKAVRPGTPGHVSWHELHAANWETAFAFYAGLLGWQKAETRVDSIGTYQQFSAGTEAIGGMFTRPGEAPSLWLYYFNVYDIEAAVKRVEAGGGEILCGPLAVPGGARVVHCLDPQGAIFALIDRHVRITIGCYSDRGRPG